MSRFEIVEPLNRDWTNELLHFPVSFAAGQQKDERLTLVAHSDGAPRPLATQVTDVRRHGDGSIASATAWCRLGLKAGQKVALQVGPAAAVGGDAGLFWKEGESCIEVGNGLLSARLPVSGTYAAQNVPGPVMALRLGDGPWMGRGRVKSDDDVIVRTRHVSQGPHFVRWQTTLCCGHSELACFECTIYAGEDFVRVEETSNFDSRLAFEINLFPGLSPDRFTFADGSEPVTRKLDYARPEELGVVDWHSGHHQMSLSWMGVYRQGATAYVGVVELDSAAWTNLSSNRIHLDTCPPESLMLRFPLQGGRKVYALLCCAVAAATQCVPDHKYSRPGQMHTRWTEVPLQKVKDWVLSWEDREPQRPFLQCGVDGVARARAMLKAHPDMRNPYEAWSRSLRANAAPPAIRADAVGYERMVLEAKARAVRPPEGASARTTLWVALDDEDHARQAVVELESAIRNVIDRVWKGGVMTSMIIFDGRSMKTWLMAYDLLKAGGLIDAKTDAWLKTQLAFLAYCFDDEEFFPISENLRSKDDPESFYRGLGQKIGDAVCPPNFTTEYYSTYGMMGCCFRSHPHAGHWRQRAVTCFNRQLDRHYYEGGAYCESPNYHGHSFMMLVQLALCLRNAGERDFFQHPRFKQQFEHFIRIQTPPILLNDNARAAALPWRYVDADSQRMAMLPGNGNTGTDCSNQPLPLELAVGAAIYRDSDPQLAGRCMTSWRRSGRPCTSYLCDLTFLLLVDPSLKGDEKLGLSSELRPGQFALMRANAETPDEVFVLIKNGTATHHMDFDDGGFSIWAYGSPIASDYGYHTFHNNRMVATGSTRHHNCLEFDDKNSGYLGIEQASPPEAFITTPLADLLVSYLPNTNLFGISHMDRPAVPRIEHRRYTLFVKPHYLLVFDSVLECRFSHKWWLHAEASDILIDGPRVRFAGKFGVDLLAQFILPQQPQFHTGELGAMKHLYAEQALANDWRVFVAPLKGGQDFQVESADNGRVVRVAGPGYQDTIFLAHYPFGFEDGKVRFRGKAGVIRTHADGRSETQLLDGEILES